MLRSKLFFIALAVLGLFCPNFESTHHLIDEPPQCESPYQDFNPQAVKYQALGESASNAAKSLLLDNSDQWKLHQSESVESEHHVFRETAAGLSLRTDLVKIERVSQDMIHEVVFAIQQRNLGVLTAILDDISNPDSDNYGQYKSREEIESLSSNSESRDEVLLYIQRAGATVVSESLFGEYITAQAPISIWEKLFNTEFFSYHYTFVEGAKVNKIVRAEKYSVPKDLHTHLASVFHTVQMPLAIWGDPIKGNINITENSHVDEVSNSITPMLLNQYYNIDSNKGSSEATQAAFGTIGNYYSPKDILNFQNNFHLPAQAVDITIGRHKDDRICTFIPELCYEANLDLQYLMAICQDSPTTYWYTDLNSFADWLLNVANYANPPLVLSISYGASETTVTKSEFDAFTFQAIKLSLMGITIIAASGDDGANGILTRVASGLCGYVPLFPASSPYVTAVGATQGPELGATEIVCQSNLGGVITSGGGFSTYYPQPSWQSNEVATYFSNVVGTIKAPVSGFKVTGRGYPDISLAGLSYLTSVGGNFISLSGTSASCPVFAGMVSLVNAARLAANKTTVGWLNPMLYSRKQSFVRDITSGKNNCAAGISGTCCAQGFHATPGWDPTTGLGSIDFVSFKREMLSAGNSPRSPTTKPTPTPTIAPTAKSTSVPTSIHISSKPTAAPTSRLTPTPTAVPSLHPTTAQPSQRPTVKPTLIPTTKPTTAQPSQRPTVKPTLRPSSKPTTAQPSQRPTVKPTLRPSSKPTTAKLL